MGELTSKVALITGGTTGIGLASAEALAAAGATVVLSARDTPRGKLAQARLRASGYNVAFHACDVSDDASVQALMSFVLDRFGRLDCAVNSAACDFQPTPLHEMTASIVSAQFAVDVVGLTNCMRAELGAMLKHGAGTIVNVASVNGMSGAPMAAVYSAGKHAVIGLTRSAAKEYIAHGIRINAVCPGATETPRRARRTEGLTPDERHQHQLELNAAIPIGRVARPEEIAQAVLWLSAPASSYVVGHSLVIDGGLSA